MPKADALTFDLKTVLSILIAVVGLASAAGVLIYRVAQLEKQVAAQTLVITALERSQTELVTALRVKEIIK